MNGLNLHSKDIAKHCQSIVLMFLFISFYFLRHQHSDPYIPTGMAMHGSAS